MDNKIVDDIANTFNRDLPSEETMDQYLAKIIPQIRNHSEDLREEKFYVGKSWIEIRDQDDFHEKVLHIFNPEGEYLISVDGNYVCGSWRPLGSKLILGLKDCEGEIFELAFMDSQFLILKKHANPKTLERKYFVMLIEPLARKLEWKEAMDYLFSKYQDSNSSYVIILVIIVLIVLIFMVLS